MNDSIGYDDLGGINIFRHIRVSELDGDTYEDKVKIVNIMGHSVITEKQYKKNLEVAVE